MSDFWSDVGDFGSSLFTGRWTGGENSVGDVWNRDPLAVIAPVAAVAGGAALGAGALGAFGAEAAGTGIAAGELGAAEAGTSALGFAPETAATVAAEDPFTAFAAASPTETAAGGGSIDSLMYGGAGNLEGPYGAMGLQSGGAGAGAPMSLSPDAAGGGSGSWLDSITGYAKAHPFQTAGMGAAAGLLGYDLLKGNAPGANTNNEQSLANTTRGQTQELWASGKQLESYLTSGTLPGPQQEKVNQAVKAAKARLIANAAKNGLNTNPTQNTALAQDLAEADLAGVRLAADMEAQLFKAGTDQINMAMKGVGMTSDMYKWLQAQDDKTNEQIQKAIMAFAAAAGGGGGGKGGVNFNIGGSRAA